LGWQRQTIHESEMALLFERTQKCCRKQLDTADIVRDAISLIIPQKGEGKAHGCEMACSQQLTPQPIAAACAERVQLSHYLTWSSGLWRLTSVIPS
jgi:hypothetical protein